MLDSILPLAKRTERSSPGMKRRIGGVSSIWVEVVGPRSEGERCETMSGVLQTLDICRPMSRPDAELPMMMTF